MGDFLKTDSKTHFNGLKETRMRPQKKNTYEGLKINKWKASKNNEQKASKNLLGGFGKNSEKVS